LGKIPVLGNLFKSRSKNQTKTNLVVFLRPTVIEDRSQSNSLTTNKLNGIWEVGEPTQKPISPDDLFQGRSPRR
jgi:general secretion pathway protein D